MNAMQLHDHLYDAGIRLVRDGDTLCADVMPGADVTPYLNLIRERTPELLKVAELREQIVAAVTVDPSEFDRVAYDALWAALDTLNTTEEDAA